MDQIKCLDFKKITNISISLGMHIALQAKRRGMNWIHDGVTSFSRDIDFSLAANEIKKIEESKITM